MVQIYSQKAARRREIRRIERRDYERGTESRHAPPPTSTGREKDADLYIDDSGSKIQKVSQRSSGRGEWRFSRGNTMYKGNICNSRKEKQSKDTQGIYHSLNSTIKSPGSEYDPCC